MILGGGKSNTLALLAPHLQGATVPPFLTISYHAWRQDLSTAVQACVKSLNGDRYADRSDAHGEDGALVSQAGRFLSILDVPSPSLSGAIDRVFKSMPGHAKDKVIVQHMVSDVMFAGVASTHRISDGAPCMPVSTIFALQREWRHQQCGEFQVLDRMTDFWGNARCCAPPHSSEPAVRRTSRFGQF